MHNQDLTITNTKEKLSKEQEKFNKLLLQLEKLEHEHDLADACTEKVEQFLIEECTVIKKTYQQETANYLIVLHQVSQEIKLTKNELRGLSDFLLSKATDLLMADCTEAQEIYDYYSNIPFENLQAIENKKRNDFLKSVIEEAGVDLEIPDDFDWSDDDKVAEFKHILEKETESRQQEAAYQARNSKAKKTKAELKAELEETEIHKIRRTIYLELVKLHHPDRFVDENEKQVNSEKLKAITEAYENEDLVELFRYQLASKIEDSAENLQKMADAKLKLINKILEEEVGLIKSEISEMRAYISERLYVGMRNIEHKAVDFAIKNFKKSLLSSVQELQAETKLLKKDKKYAMQVAKSHTPARTRQFFDYFE